MAHKYSRSQKEILRSLVHYACQDRQGMLGCLCEDGRGKEVTPDDLEYVKEIEALLVDFIKFDLNHRLGNYTRENLETAIFEISEKGD